MQYERGDIMPHAHPITGESMVNFCYIMGPSWREMYLSDKKTFFIKIGCTSNPNNRIINLKTAWPAFNLLHLWWMDSGGGRFIEKELHEYYRPARYKGELFLLPLAEIQWLQTKPSLFFIDGMFGWLKKYSWLAKWEAAPTDFDLGKLEDYLWAQKEAM